MTPIESHPILFDIIVREEWLEEFGFTALQIAVLKEIAKENTKNANIGLALFHSEQYIKSVRMNQSAYYVGQTAARYGISGMMEQLALRPLEPSGWIPMLLTLGYAHLIPHKE